MNDLHWCARATRVIEQAIARGELIDDVAAKEGIDVDYAYRIADRMERISKHGFVHEIEAELQRVMQAKVDAEAEAKLRCYRELSANLDWREAVAA